MEDQSPDEVGPPGILGAFWEELAATLAIARQTSFAFWCGFLGLFGSLALVGLLPLGRASVYLQCVSLTLLGLLLLQSEGLARSFREDDVMELVDREGLHVVAHLPAFLVLAAFPLYLVGQAILFQRVMVHYPGILEGTGWGDAWRLSLNNVLYTEILFDAVDVFRLRLASDPEHRVGQALVFLTRALLSLAFIRVLIQLGRAAYFRAHDLGRGIDYGKALAMAVAEKDAPGIHYAAEGLTDGLADATVRLTARAAGPDRDPTARRSLHALSGWSAPGLRLLVAEVPDFAPHMRELLRELEEGTPPPPPAIRSWRWWRFLLPPVLLAILLLALHSLGGWPALGLGVLVFVALGWLLVTPKASLERGVALGVLPRFPGRHLARWTVAWAVLLSLAVVGTAWVVFGVAAETLPQAFAAPTPPGRLEMGYFVLANLLRLQVFFSAPDLFGLALPPVEQRPLLGSLLTLLFRSALNVGLVAVLLTALSVSYSRNVGGSRLLGNDELAIRVETDRGGLFAPELVRQHWEALKEEAWDLLRTTSDARVRRTLAFAGLYDWIVEDPPEWVLADVLSTCLVAAWYVELGEQGPAQALLERVEAEGRVHVLFPPDRVQLSAIRAQVLARLGRTAEAEASLLEAEREFARQAGDMVEEDRVETEEELALAREALNPEEADPAENLER